MNTPEDASLKRDFENLRENDRRTAPDFLSTVSAARGRTVAAGPPRSRNRIFIAGALLFAAAAGTMLVIRPHGSTAPTVRETGSLFAWSSPTAFLLETPGKQFWSETPRLGDREIYGLPGARKERK